MSRAFRPNEWLDEAADIVRAAGDLLRGGPDGALSVELKGDVDLVTEMDRRSEKLIVEALTERFPGTGILAEEGSGHSVDARGVWILDPLDGTTNYAHGFPVYAVSLAYRQDGILEIGIVHDPSRGETFTAVRGGGAFLDGRPIHVTSRDKLGAALLATGFPYDIRDSERDNLRQFGLMAKRARGIRRAGAAALDLAYVAAGRFDGYWEEKIAVWDVAAGFVLVREAGGRISDYLGRPAEPSAGRIVATNGLIHDELVAALGEAEPPSRH